MNVDMSENERDNLLLGTDFQVNNMKLPNNQLATVSGMDNLSQAIEHKLMTPLNLYFDILDDYGIDLRDFIAMKKFPRNIQWLCFMIQRAVMTDERIEDARVSYDEDEGFILNYQRIDNPEIISLNIGDISSNDMNSGEE